LIIGYPVIAVRFAAVAFGGTMAGFAGASWTFPVSFRMVSRPITAPGYS
jgi:ABC-type uncharacterized transport system permease subunit